MERKKEQTSGFTKVCSQAAEKPAQRWKKYILSIYLFRKAFPKLEFYKLFTTNAVPDRISIMMTDFLTAFSFKNLALSIPRTNPASIRGTRTIACFTVSSVIIPHSPYKIIRNVFSTRNTTQILALKERLPSVTLLT